MNIDGFLRIESSKGRTVKSQEQTEDENGGAFSSLRNVLKKFVRSRIFSAGIYSVRPDCPSIIYLFIISVLVPDVIARSIFPGDICQHSFYCNGRLVGGKGEQQCSLSKFIHIRLDYTCFVFVSIISSCNSNIYNGSLFLNDIFILHIFQLRVFFPGSKCF